MNIKNGCVYAAHGMVIRVNKFLGVMAKVSTVDGKAHYIRSTNIKSCPSSARMEFLRTRKLFNLETELQQAMIGE